LFTQPLSALVHPTTLCTCSPNHQYSPINIRVIQPKKEEEEEEEGDSADEEGEKGRVGSGSEVAVRQVSCGGGHTCFISKAGEVYSAGFNARGQLGLGHHHDTAVPAKVRDCVCALRLCMWCAIVYVLRDCVCALLTTVIHQVALMFFSDTEVTKIRCGDAFSAAVTRGGAALYTWGWGGSGQLGYLHSQSSDVGA
jgi:alpha-tubulin suppressor-like RCC1 family protein